MAPGFRAGNQVDSDIMISTPTSKPAHKRKAKARTANRSASSGIQKQEEKQVIQPEIDSVALRRRAEELSTEIQRESVVVASQEKVDRIKAELENGSYEVDADAIAEKLMEFDFQIEDKQKPR